MNTPNQASSNQTPHDLESSTQGSMGPLGSDIPSDGGQENPVTGSADARSAANSPNTAVLNELQDKAAELAKEAKARGQAELDQYRQSAVSQVETLAQSARAAANTLQTNDSLGLSRSVAEMADNMLRFADRLRGKNLDELLHDAGELARNNPALFLAGSLAVGFGLTRLVKASSPIEQASGPNPRAETVDESDWQTGSQSVTENPGGDWPGNAPSTGESLRNDL